MPKNVKGLVGVRVEIPEKRGKKWKAVLTFATREGLVDHTVEAAGARDLLRWMADEADMWLPHQRQLKPIVVSADDFRNDPGKWMKKKTPCRGLRIVDSEGNVSMSIY